MCGMLHIVYFAASIWICLRFTTLSSSWFNNIRSHFQETFSVHWCSGFTVNRHELEIIVYQHVSTHSSRIRI